MPLRRDLIKYFILAAMFTGLAAPRVTHGADYKSAPSKKIVSIDSSLILDWIAIPKIEKGVGWVENIYTINEVHLPRLKEDRINNELHALDYEEWTKLSEPKPIILISESGMTAVKWIRYIDLAFRRHLRLL